MATTAARSPSPGQARPCCAMRRSADSSPFKPADCPQRTAPSSASKGGGGACGCHASPRRSWEKENDAAAARTPKAAHRSSTASKNFMAPTISAASKAVAASPSPRKKVLGERNEEPPHIFAPFSPANLAHKSDAGSASARRLRLSFDGPAPAPPPAAARTESPTCGDHHQQQQHAVAADSVDAEPSRSGAALYDPKTNYTSPRPRFLHYKPNPRIDMYRHGGSGARRLDEGLASESSDESLATTTDEDDLTEEEQEQAQQQPEQPSALAAPSEAGDTAAVPAAVSWVIPPGPAAPASPWAPVLTSEPVVKSQPARVLATEPRASSPRARAAVAAAASCILPPEPAPGSPRAPVLTSDSAAMSPPARVLAMEPRATSPRTRALTPEPELGVSPARAPAKKRSVLSFMFPLALILCIAAAFVSVSLPPDSAIMSNTAVSKVSNFLSVQELHPVELAAWLKQWSSSSLDSITSYWEAFTSTQEQEYFGPRFAANLSAASADADHGADFYYNFAEASPMPSEEPVGASFLEEQLKFQDVVSATNTDLTALLEGDDVVEEESDASEYYSVAGVEMSEEAPGSNGASFMEEQLTIQDVASASNTDLTAQAGNAVVVEEESIAVAEESDASDYYKVTEELDLEMPEQAPASDGEEIASSFSQKLDIPSQPAGEQDVEGDESEDDHTNAKEGQEAYRGLQSDSSMWPSYLDKISKPAAAAAGVALLVVILSAGIAVFSMRKKQTQVQVASNASAPVEEPEQAENQSVESHHPVEPSQSVSGSSQGHLVKPSQFQSSMAEETERFEASVFSQHSSSLSSGQGRRRKTKEEESLLGLEPTSRRESTSQSTSSYGSFTTFEKIAAKKRNKEDEAMTPVRRSSRLRTVKSPES